MSTDYTRKQEDLWNAVSLFGPARSRRRRFSAVGALVRYLALAIVGLWQHEALAQESQRKFGPQQAETSRTKLRPWLLAGPGLPPADEKLQPGSLVTDAAHGEAAASGSAAAEAAGSAASTPTAEVPDLSKVSLEEILQVKIKSLSRRPQRLSRAAAAVTVITQDDIRRSGAVNIAEVLRRVPGLQVSRVDSSKWAVSSRGFVGRFANKQLVMIDGRTIYNNMFSGVYWDNFDIALEDIDRIEVIRGPGATSWGANAMNGVINILTKAANGDDRGGASFGSGGDEQAYMTARGTKKLGESTYLKGSTKMANYRSQTVNLSDSEPGFSANDQWSQRRGTFRLDSKLSKQSNLSATGELYKVNTRQRVAEGPINYTNSGFTEEDVHANGGWAQARWEHTGEKSNFGVQYYLTRETRREGTVGVAEWTVMDLDAQHQIALGERHDLTWGTGIRNSADQFEDGPNFTLRQKARTDRMYSSFVEYEWRIVPDKFAISGGSKFMRSTFAGFQYQPGVRAVYTPQKDLAVWSAVTRAVRTPSRRDLDIAYRFPISAFGQGIFGEFIGSPDFKSETAKSFEAGVRKNWGNRFSIDVAAYYSIYRNLESNVVGNPTLVMNPTPILLIPIVSANNAHAFSKGIEIASMWRPLRDVKISANYTRTKFKFFDPTAFFSKDFLTADRSAEHLFFSEISWDLRRKWSIDTQIYGVSRLARSSIPRVVRADVRVSYRPNRDWELAVGGRNLQQANHLEFINEDFVGSSDFRRGPYVRLTRIF